MATLDEVATFVATATGLTVGTTVFKGLMPDTPDACCVVTEYGGLAPDHTFGQSAVSVEYPKVQVVFRGAENDYDGPRDLAETAYRACAAAGAQTISSTRFLDLSPLQSPFFLGKDNNRRPLIAFNVQVRKELSA